MKKLISVLCIILILSVFFCGCTQRTRNDITDDVMPNVSDTPATNRPQGTDAPGKDDSNNDNDVDILPDMDSNTDGTDRDSGVDNNNTTAEPTASPEVSPAVSPIG